MVDEHKTAAKALRKLIANIMWHMRGSISREEAWTMCHLERDDVMELIGERQQIVQKTGLPLL